MATTVTKVIDPDMGSGYDYDSLYDWEAAQQGDLTGVRDEIAVAKCRCTGGTADEPITLAGWTTAPTKFVKIWTDPAESHRHEGVWSDSKVRLFSYGSNIITMTGSVQYLHLEGLQFYQAPADDWDYGVQFENGDSSGNGWIKVIDCIFRQVSTAHYVGIIGIEIGWSASLYAINNIFYGFKTTGSNCEAIALWNTNAWIFNNTFHDCVRAIHVGLDGTATLKNNLFSACTTDIYKDGTGTQADTYSATTNDNTKGLTPAGTGNRFSQTFSFVGAPDFHLASNDGGAKGYGTNLYNDADFPFQTDIDGQDRGGSGSQWDIGADEYIAIQETVSDGFTAGETLSRSSTFRNTITDGFKGSEAIPRRSDMRSSSADGAKIAEVLARVLSGSRTVADGVTLAEVIARGMNLQAAATDGANASDSAARVSTARRTATDGAKMADTPSGIARLSLTITDGAKVSDSAARVTTFRSSVSDGVELSEAIATAAVLVAAAVDGSKFGEALQADAQGLLAASISDGFKMSESQATIGHFFKSAADGAKIGEAIARILTAVKSASDGVRLAEALARVLSGSETAADGAVFAETLARVSSTSRTAADGFTLAEILARISTTARTAADGFVLSDEDIGEIFISIIRELVSDGFVASDAATVRADYDITVSDGVQFSEVVAAILRFTTAVVDGFQVGDVVVGVEVNLISGMILVTITTKRATITFTAKRPDAEFVAKRPEIIFN